MKSYLIVSPGLEKVAQQDLKKAIVNPGVLEFSVKDKEELLSLAFRLQSVRRVLVAVGKSEKVEEVDLGGVDWNDFLSKEVSLKIEVENVRGQDNRVEIAKKFGQKLFPHLEQQGIKAKVDYKKPEIVVVIYFSAGQYFVGIDFCGKELDKRDYRVFAHSASFRGDLAYYLVRKSGFQAGEKLLIGFSRDGAMAIEAALFANQKFVHDLKSKDFSFYRFPLFKDFDFDSFFRQKSSKEIVYSFDPGMRSITAARKNAALAGVKELVEINKYSLEELDVKYEQSYFDRFIIHLTTKDEGKINEIYYQASYILKKKGTLLLICREGLELSISDKFKLVKEEKIVKGDSVHKLWLLEKK